MTTKVKELAREIFMARLSASMHNSENSRAMPGPDVVNIWYPGCLAIAEAIIAKEVPEEPLGTAHVHYPDL